MNDFHKTRRLLKKVDYDNVFAQACKWATPNFIFLYCKNTIGHARLGLAISKKMIPKSHDRNRVKRLIRETFRTKTLMDVDIIVLAKRGINQKNNPELMGHLNKAWDKWLR